MDKIKVKYIGDRPEWRDNLYGSGGVWHPNSAVLVSAEAAERLLQHPEFVRDDKAKAIEAVQVKEEEQADEPPLANLDAMTKAQLTEYAHRNFGIVLPSNLKVEEARNQIRLQMGKKVV